MHRGAILELTTLQVGVKKGGSIKMLREYFDHKCTIIGVDVDKGCPQFPYDAHIKTVLASSLDADSMRKAFKVKTPSFTEAVFDSVTDQGYEGQVDVIIDDGLHRMGSVSATFWNLWPLLSPTGIYLLEDIHRDVDLHNDVWRIPFRTFDPKIEDPAALNAVQVPTSKIKLVFHTDSIFRSALKTARSSKIFGPFIHRALLPPGVSFSILSVTDCCADCTHGRLNKLNFTGLQRRSLHKPQ